MFKPYCQLCKLYMVKGLSYDNQGMHFCAVGPVCLISHHVCHQADQLLC